MMKKALGLFLSLVIVLTMIPAMVLPASAVTDGWNGWLKLSSGASVDTTECSWSYGAVSSVTFKVTLTNQGDYAQLNHNITALPNDGTIDVKIVPDAGDNTAYENVNFNLQFTSDAAAASDISPSASTSITWYILGNSDRVWTGRGTSTANGGNFGPNSAKASYLPNGLCMHFTKNASDYMVFDPVRTDNDTSPKNSTQTLTSIGASSGVYFRIRNQSTTEHTYKVTVEFPTVTHSDSTYILSDGGSVLKSHSETENVSNSITRTATFELSANGGYVQLSQKLFDLSDTASIFDKEHIVDVQLRIGDSTSADYLNTNVDIQLTTDPDASTDCVPILEHGKTKEQIPTDALSWGFTYYSNNYIYLAKGLAHTTGGVSLTGYNSSIFSSNGLGLRLTRNEDGTLKGRWLNGDKSATSVHTVSEISGEDGMYLRIRNNGSSTLTYTMTVTSATPIVKNATGSTVDSYGISYDVSGKTMYQTATVTLAANGGYAQFSRRMTDLAQGDTVHVTVVPGDGTQADYEKMDCSVQLVPDSTAANDCVPIAEGGGAPTDAISWSLMYNDSNLLLSKGRDLSTVQTLTTPETFATDSQYSTRLRISNSGGYAFLDWANAPTKNYTSSRTLAQVGIQKGAYLRIRNNSAEEITYTVTVWSATWKQWTTGSMTLDDSNADYLQVNASTGAGTANFSKPLSLERGGSVSTNVTFNLSGNTKAIGAGVAFCSNQGLYYNLGTTSGYQFMVQFGSGNGIQYYTSQNTVSSWYNFGTIYPFALDTDDVTYTVTLFDCDDDGYAVWLTSTAGLSYYYNIPTSRLPAHVLSTVYLSTGNRFTLTAGNYQVTNPVKKSFSNNFSRVRGYGLSPNTGTGLSDSEDCATFTGTGGCSYMAGYATKAVSVDFQLSNWPAGSSWYSIGIVNTPNAFWNPSNLAESHGLVTQITPFNNSLGINMQVNNVTSSFKNCGTVNSSVASYDTMHTITFYKVGSDWRVALDSDKSVTVPQADVDLGDKLYLVVGAGGGTGTASLDAKEMTETVTATIKRGDRVMATEEYSVKSAAEYYINSGSSSAALKDLMKAMLAYGAQAQTQFSYNTGSLATAGVDYSDYEAADLDSVYTIIPHYSGYKTTYADHFAQIQMEYLGSSLVLESETAYNLTFQINMTDNPERSNPTAVTDNTTGNALGFDGFTNWKGLRTYSIQNIAPVDLFKDVTVHFVRSDGTGHDDDFTITFNPGTYIYQQMKKADSAETATIKNTMRKLFDYYFKAATYFGSPSPYVLLDNEIPVMDGD